MTEINLDRIQNLTLEEKNEELFIKINDLLADLTFNDDSMKFNFVKGEDVEFFKENQIEAKEMGEDNFNVRFN